MVELMLHQTIEEGLHYDCFATIVGSQMSNKHQQLWPSIKYFEIHPWRLGTYFCGPRGNSIQKSPVMHRCQKSFQCNTVCSPQNRTFFAILLCSQWFDCTEIKCCTIFQLSTKQTMMASASPRFVVPSKVTTGLYTYSWRTLRKWFNFFKGTPVFRNAATAFNTKHCLWLWWSLWQERFLGTAFLKFLFSLRPLCVMILSFKDSSSTSSTEHFSSLGSENKPIKCLYYSSYICNHLSCK